MIKTGGNILTAANLDVLDLLRLALQLSQEPSDINRLLVFWMVKVEANDQIQNIKDAAKDAHVILTCMRMEPLTTSFAELHNRYTIP